MSPGIIFTDRFDDYYCLKIRELSIIKMIAKVYSNHNYGFYPGGKCFEFLDAACKGYLLAY